MVSNSKKVIHIAPNGEKTIYSNLGEASKATGLSYTHVSKLLTTGNASRQGHRFEYAEPQEVKEKEKEKQPYRNVSNNTDYFDIFVDDMFEEFKEKQRFKEVILACFTLEQAKEFLDRVSRYTKSWEFTTIKEQDQYYIQCKKKTSENILEELKKRKTEVEQKLSDEEDKMKEFMDRIEEYKKLLLHYDNVIHDLEAR